MLLPIWHAPDTVSAGISLKTSSTSTYAFYGIAGDQGIILVHHRGLKDILLRPCKSFVVVLQYLCYGSIGLLLQFCNDKRYLFGEVGRECHSVRVLARNMSTFSARVWYAI